MSVFFSKFGKNVNNLFQHFLFRVLSFGPIPQHIAFIMDGNRRYARNRGMVLTAGYQAGFGVLLSILKHCYELGVKYVTLYAFSIDNFKRRPDEVQPIMELLLEKIEGLLKEDSLVNNYGVKVIFLGNLDLLDNSVKAAAEKVMAATCQNTTLILSVCIAYTSTDEIVHAVQELQRRKFIEVYEKNCEIGYTDDTAAFNLTKCDHDNGMVTVADIEKNMYTAQCPDPDILVRTSGETRLSNFLLWQTSCCYLFAPNTLWPEVSLRHLIWALLEYQRVKPYLDKRRKRVQQDMSLNIVDCSCAV